jgi:hypothetical protein
MVKARRSLPFAAGLLLTGCIVTPLLTTTTEVIAPGDAVPVFGTQAAIRVGQQPLIFRWDPASQAYKPPPSDGGMIKAARVARLKGDVYLLQGEMEDTTDGYVLVPFRVSGAREVMPLACDVPRTAAEAFGVRTGSREGFALELAGDRAGIVGVLAAAVGSCKPQFQIDTFVPLGRELAAQAAVPGASPSGCRPCPAGACVQATVSDESGASLAGASIRAGTSSGAAGAPTARSDASGNFLLTGLPDGRADLRIELAGFSALKVPPIQVKSGTTYLFDEPFELVIAQPPFETVAPPRQPRPCTGTRSPR